MRQICKKWMIKTGVLLLLLFSSPSAVFAADTIKYEDSICKSAMIEKGVKKVGKLTVTSPSKNKIKVKWKSLGNNYLYEVQCSLDKKFPRNNKTLTSILGHRNSVPVNLEASGKVIYVRVRAFHRWKYAYGPWSSVARIRVK